MGQTIFAVYYQRYNFSLSILLISIKTLAIIEISKISKLTTISGEFSKKFLTMLTLLGSSGYPQGPLSAQSAYLNTLECRFFVFWAIAKIESHAVNYLTMLTLLVWHPSLAGIFPTLWHIVAETPTNIKQSLTHFYHFTMVCYNCFAAYYYCYYFSFFFNSCHALIYEAFFSSSKTSPTIVDLILKKL